MTMYEQRGRSPEQLAAAFEHFAEFEVSTRAPLYAVFCRGIAGDPALIDLAAHAASGQPAPNLLLGAVHYLLLRGATHPLRAYFPDLTADPAPREQAFPAFRAFCLAHRDTIAALLETRLVQTAHVRRCTALLPAFALVHERARGQPLGLVELGPSAGLNLLFDRYGYGYSDGTRCGDPRAALLLTSELRGPAGPPLPAALPPVAFRTGLDLKPIDVRDGDATLWLRALIWPGETGRAAELEAALAIAREDPPELIRGDALETLPPALARVPREAAAVVFHSHTTNQMGAEGRARLDRLLDTAGRTRPVYRIGMEFSRGGTDPSLDLTLYHGGDTHTDHLGSCDAHGAWLAWTGPTPLPRPLP